MNTYPLRFSLLLFLALFTFALPAAVNVPATPAPVAVDFSTMSRADLEAQLGRKLKFKERVGFWLLKKKLRRQARKTQADGRIVDGFAIASLLCGIFGWLFFPGLLAIIFGFISLGRIKRDPERLKGKGAAIIGLVLGLGLVLGWLIFAYSFTYG